MLPIGKNAPLDWPWHHRHFKEWCVQFAQRGWESALCRTDIIVWKANQRGYFAIREAAMEAGKWWFCGGKKVTAECIKRLLSHKVTDPTPDLPAFTLRDLSLSITLRLIPFWPRMGSSQLITSMPLSLQTSVLDSPETSSVQEVNDSLHCKCLSPSFERNN